MSQPQEEIARNAAAKLAASVDPQLPQYTEMALAGDGAVTRTLTFLDTATTIAVASLLVNLATLAWKIYQDCRSDGSKPAPEPMSRQIRIQVELPASVSPKERDRMIEVVVRETIEYGDKK